MDIDGDVLRSSRAIARVRYKSGQVKIFVHRLFQSSKLLMSMSVHPADTMCLPTMPFNTPFAQPLESETDHLKVAEQNLAFVTELLKRLEKEFKKTEVQEKKDKES
jgi:hypothetical protein